MEQTSVHASFQGVAYCISVAASNDRLTVEVLPSSRAADLTIAARYPLFISVFMIFVQVTCGFFCVISYFNALHFFSIST